MLRAGSTARSLPSLGAGGENDDYPGTTWSSSYLKQAWPVWLEVRDYERNSGRILALAFDVTMCTRAGGGTNGGFGAARPPFSVSLISRPAHLSINGSFIGRANKKSTPENAKPECWPVSSPRFRAANARLRRLTCPAAHPSRLDVHPATTAYVRPPMRALPGVQIPRASKARALASKDGINQARFGDLHLLETPNLVPVADASMHRRFWRCGWDVREMSPISFPLASLSASLSAVGGGSSRLLLSAGI